MADSATSLLGPPPAGATGPKTQTITPRFVSPAPGATGAKVTPQVTGSNTVTSLLGDPKDPKNRPIDNYGTDWQTQADFLAGSSDAERTLALERAKRRGLIQGYGTQPIIPEKPDAGMEWYVIKDGKKIAVLDPFASVKTASAAVGAHPVENVMMMLTALVPEFSELAPMAGAVRTGELEGAKGMEIARYVVKRIGKDGAYALIRSGATALAAGAGFAADEVIKGLNRTWQASGPEEIARILHEMSVGATSEMFSRIMSEVPRALSRGYSLLLPAEHKATVKSTIGRKMTPGIYGATKAKSVLGTWEQSLIEYVLNFGRPLQEKSNLEAIKTELKKQLIRTGMTPSQADTALQSVMDSVQQRIGRTGVNQDLRNRADQIIGDLKAGVDVKRQALEADFNARMAQLEQLIGSPDPATQELAQQEMIKARQKFGEDASELYAKVDAEIAGSPEPIVVDMAAAKAKAREIWKQLPRDQFGNVVFGGKPQLGGVLMDLMNMPEFAEFKVAQRIRKALYDAGEYKNLTGGLNSKLLNELGDVLDKSFETADMSAAQPAAVKALRDADTFWRENIDRFQGLRVDQLMSGRVLLEPEEVANIIFKRGMTPEAERFKSLMTPQGWANVTAAFWSKMKDEATNKLTEKIDADLLLKSVRRNMNLLKVAFGDAPAANMEKIAEENAAIHGTLEPTDLAPGNFRTKVEEWKAADAALQEKLKSDYITMLMDRSPEQKDAIKFMLDQPGRIAHAKAFFGEASPQWQRIKGQAMAEILARGLSKEADPTKAIFGLGGLSGALARFSDAELVDLFGRDHAADLKQLAKDIDLVQTRPGAGHRMTGAFAAATLVLHPLTHLPALIKLGLTGVLLSDRRFVQWFATGFEPATQARLAEHVRTGKAIVMFLVPGVSQYFDLSASGGAIPPDQPDSGTQLGRGVGHL